MKNLTLIFMMALFMATISVSAFADITTNSASNANATGGTAIGNMNAPVANAQAGATASPTASAIGNNISSNQALNANATSIGNQNTAQGGNANSGATAGNNTTTVNQGDINFAGGQRSYPIPGSVSYGALPSYFGDNNRPGHQFIPLDKILMYSKTWPIESVIKMNASRWNGKNMELAPLIERVSSNKQTKSIICTKDMIDLKGNDVWQLAWGTVNSTNANVISAEIFSAILVEATKYGATHVQFLGEGTNTELSTEGVGIGLNYTKATDSSVSTGGTGWSKGWSGYNNLPWLQFIYLRVVPKPAPAVSKVIIRQPVIGKALPVKYSEQVEVASNLSGPNMQAVQSASAKK